jgi:FAD/FMN-containing dehydrogenase/NAD-dependent dihydropyrimidine dehydrogenase PreA subunit
MKTLEEEFRQIEGDIKIIDKAEELEMYSHDIGDVPPIMIKSFFKTMPTFVVQPETKEEIQKVLRFANEKKVPVIARGAASWGFGGVIPTKAGIVIDLSPFRKILELNIKDKSVTVEAGARWSDIDIAAKKEGLCLMSYPSSKFSTVAGWISTGGYGINSFRYGHLSNQITSMTVITGTGEIKKLTPADKDFKYFISTEGEFGIIVEATLKLRDVPQATYPHLLYFGSDKDAFMFIKEFINTMPSQKLNPNVIRFVDENHLGDINEMMHAVIFKKTAGVLIEFGSTEDDEVFSKFMALNASVEEAPSYVANYLWNERLFGMKTKRLGPTILASEIVIPIKAAAAFTMKAKKLGNNFGVEVCIDSYIIDEHNALIMSTFLCDSRSKKYFISMPLVSLLTKAAVGLGAKPYGLGLWNASFINYLFSRQKLSELKSYKQKVDPENIMNPGKFFSVDSNVITAGLFHPVFFNLSMSILSVFSPIIGRIIIMIFGRNRKVDSLDLELSTHACAKCGNCIAVCPAYLVTKDEALTAKGKIALAIKLSDGKDVTPEEAAKAFMCMKCKACEDICQTNLELMALWEALEKRIGSKYGRPESQIAEFLKKVDESRDYWDMVESNS